MSDNTPQADSPTDSPPDSQSDSPPNYSGSARPENALFHLCYVSTETEHFTQDDLVALLGVARTANTEHDVTGLLLYREGSFYQLLEGKQTAVNHIFEVINQDPRHKEVRILFSGEIETREFSDWRMGFLNLDGVKQEALSGFSNFLEVDAHPQEFLEKLSRGKRLALMFRTML